LNTNIKCVSIVYQIARQIIHSVIATVDWYI